MSRNSKSSPSMDFEELRRRHEQFKARQEQKPQPQPRQETPVSRPVAEPKAAVEPEPVENAPEPVVIPAAKPEFSTPSLFAEEEELSEPTTTDPQEPAIAEAETDAAEAPNDVLEEVYEAPLQADTPTAASEPDEEEDESPFHAFAGLGKGVTGVLKGFGKRKAEKRGDEFDEEPIDEDIAPQEAEDPFEETEAIEPFEEEPPKRRRFSLFGRKRKEEVLEYDDSDAAYEDYAEQPQEESIETAPAQEIAPETADVPAEPVEAFDTPAEDVPVETATPIADIEETPAYEDAPPVEEPTQVWDEDAEEDWRSESDVEAFDEDEEYEDDVPAKRKSGFKKFLNLFVVKDGDDLGEDEEEDEDDDDFDLPEQSDALDMPADIEPIEETAPQEVEHAEVEREEKKRSFFHWRKGEKTPQEDWADSIDQSKIIEGGYDMDERNSVNTELTEQLAEGLAGGMSRRERRELAARLAAEEAARKAAEAPEPIEEDPVPVLRERMTRVVEEEPVSDLFGETRTGGLNLSETAQEESDEPDEPTRIFRRITDEDIPAAKEAEEEETAPEEKKGRFSLFHKKDRSEEEDDEDDEDEDDEEEEETSRRRVRRGRSGRKGSVRYEEDEEDDYDEEDDDYDDEYDDYDDDDYDDEDDDGRPFGHHLIGFFKGLLTLVLILLLIVVALNFLDYFNVVNLDGVWAQHYDKAPKAFDTLFPSHNFKQEAPAASSFTPVETVPTAEALPSPIPEAQPTQQPAATQAPVETDAPVTVTDAPAEAPAAVG